MHLGYLFGCYDDPKIRKKSGSGVEGGGDMERDAHECIDPVLGHPSFLFILRDRNKGAANYHPTNVEEDGLELGVGRHVMYQGSKEAR